MDKLLLIDGNSLINRAFYATPPLSDDKGRPTNAVMGFINMLIKMMGDFSPTYILVAFDRKEPTFRHQIFTEYKGTRKPMPDDLRPQIPLLKEVLSTMGIAIFDKAGIEADDIIGTLSKNYNGETIIVTGDKDSFQLVDESSSVCFTKRGISDIELYTIDNFKEKTGILPSQITDLKALMGDSSDNIPGIAGIGEKTALTLISTYDSIDGLYENLNELKGKLLEKVASGKDNCYLSKRLATIKTDVEIPLKVEDMVYNFPFDDKVKRLFTELNFRGFLRRTELFSESVNNADSQAETNKEVNLNLIKITSPSELEKVFSSDIISLFIDKNINIYCGNENEYFLPIKETFFDDGFEFDGALKLLEPYLLDENKTIICYSYKKLAHLLKEFNIEIKCRYHDVDIQRYLVDFSGREESEREILYYYNYNLNYPAYSLFDLSNKFLTKIKDENLLKLYNEVEIPLAKVLFDMEIAGFAIDVETLNVMQADFKAKLDEVLKEIYSLVGETINVNSPKQLAELLFVKLGLKKGKKNKSGSYSTNAEALEEIYDEHPVIPLILKYRSVQKLYSTYVEGLKPLVDKQTGLVHTSFNQTLTQTGRLSSKEPNLQNIPIRDEEGKELRKLFVPRAKNRVLIDADYSQIELRLLAHFSRSKELIDAYNEGRDIHSLTASQVFGVPLDKVDSSMRRSAKAVNFGIIYGISEYGLAKNLKIKPYLAKEYITKYFEMYPSVKEYMQSNVNFARENGFVNTLLNRKRYIKEINSPNFNLRSFGERAAMNMPLQGSSADIIKIAMVNVSERLKKECKNSYLILQVHDELIIDADESELSIAKNILKEEMENAVKLRVPLTVEVGTGKSWFLVK